MQFSITLSALKAPLNADIPLPPTVAFPRFQATQFLIRATGTPLIDPIKAPLFASLSSIQFSMYRSNAVVIVCILKIADVVVDPLVPLLKYSKLYITVPAPSNSIRIAFPLKLTVARLVVLVGSP